MFYHYRQNNSGGQFAIEPDDGISVNVIIEATDAEDANECAVGLGLYFDGCSRGWDCSCCGDRWYPASEADAEIDPCIYGDPIHRKGATVGSNWAAPSPEGFIHYADGRIEAIWVGAVADAPGSWWGVHEAIVTPWPLVEGSVVEQVCNAAARAIAA